MPYVTPTTTLDAAQHDRASFVIAISMQIDHTSMTSSYAHLVTAPESHATGISQHTNSRCCSLGIKKNAVNGHEHTQK